MYGVTSLVAAVVSATCLLSVAVRARAVKGDSPLLDKPQDVPGSLTLTDPRLSQLLQLFLDSQRGVQEEEPVAPLELEAKRSWEDQAWPVPPSIKRKMFWTPLGHMPAAARLGGRQPHTAHIDDNSSPVFRYG